MIKIRSVSATNGFNYELTGIENSNACSSGFELGLVNIICTS